MRNRTDIISKMNGCIECAVACSDEAKVTEYLHRAYDLGWVIGLEVDEVNTLYGAEMIKKYIVEEDD